MNKYAMFMPVSGLASRHGVGDFGESCFSFLSFLKSKRYQFWQILPLNPIGPGGSPYMSICSRAFEYRYISLDLLTEEGLIPLTIDYLKNSDRVDYYKTGVFKEKYLRLAYKSFLKMNRKCELEEFLKEESWVFQYALFSCLLTKNSYSLWNLWPKEEQDINYSSNIDVNKYKDFYYLVFVQYYLLKQWKKVLARAKELNIKIIGDMPFYVDFNSVECFYNRKNFDLDSKYHINHVGGFPSVFGDNGQYWGTPCYNFSYLKKDNYDFLVTRLGNLFNNYDIIRLDHFLGYNEFYSIEYGRDNGLVGKWKHGPKKYFFEAFFNKYKEASLIVEDLGWVKKNAIKIRKDFSLPGMNVCEFTFFDPNFKHDSSLNVYTSTHDAPPLKGWVKYRNKEELLLLKKKISYKKGDFYLSLLKYVITLPSNITVICMNDYLAQDEKTQINRPSTFGSPNWEYRIKELPLKGNKYSRLIDSITLGNRS